MEQTPKKRSFLSRFIPGYKEQESELNVVQKNFVPEFFKSEDDTNKRDDT